MVKIEHGFTWFNSLCLILVVALFLSIKWGMVIIPQIRSTAAQVANLNNLPNVDCIVKTKGLMIISPTITVSCRAVTVPQPCK